MKTINFATVVLTACLALLTVGACNADSPRGSQASLPVLGAFPTLDGATEWLNSPPIAPSALRGKVVVVQFWTYSCINWRRAHPYVQAWADTYRDAGLVVIGVHTPEFAFEKELRNVRQAIAEIGVRFPVVVDNEQAVWNAFSNQYWPALYFIDARGQVRHSHFGEGQYEKSEWVIRQLLEEAGASVPKNFAKVDPVGAEAPADWANLKSNENYLGYGRTENFDSVGGLSPDKPRRYAAPARLPVNHWALTGDWTARRHQTVLDRANGRLTYRFHARDLHLVMGPGRPDAPVRFRVTVDGKPPGVAHGVDVDDKGHGVADQQRMYHLIRQSGPIVERQFEIEFFEPGAEVFALTFG